MADFDIAINTIIKNEGKFSDNNADKGGPTNFGISLRFLRGLGKSGDINLDGVIDINDIKYLTLEMADNLYHHYFWDEYGYGQIKDQDIATKIFDISVNAGPGNAASIVQRAVNYIVTGIGRASEAVLDVDGVLGPKSIKEINNVNPTEGLLVAIILFQKMYYQKVLKKFPDQKEFINGWIKRAEKI